MDDHSSVAYGGLCGPDSESGSAVGHCGSRHVFVERGVRLVSKEGRAAKAHFLGGGDAVGSSGIAGKGPIRCVIRRR